MLRRPLLLLSLALLALTTTGLSADRRSLVSSGDAFVMADPDTGSWTIGSSTIRFTLTLDKRSGLRVMDLSNPYTGQWSVGVAPDTTVSLGSGELTLGTRALVFEGAEASQYRGGVRLDLSFISSSPPAKVTRSYVCYPRTPIVEMWTTFEPAAANRLTVANLNAFELTVQPGVIQWVNGLGTPPAEGGPFTLMSRELKPGDSLSLGAVKRSTEQALPWFKIEAEADEFFGGLIWSGSWQLMLSRTDAGVRVSLGLPPFSTETGAPLETPHGFFGVAGGSVGEASEALQTFVMHALRQGRAFQPLVAYNTWFTYGTAIDHQMIIDEIDHAAELDIEVFVVDAGWYPNNSDDPFDFTTGLGLWHVDAKRFPLGLRALRDYAHDRGLRFGIWVEPERVALSRIGQPYRARQRWLATSDGKYNPNQTGAPKSAQVCLADPEGRQWVLDRVIEFIETVRPDYLKWDNNLWVNCDRPGHGHAKEDGNFAQVRGLYEIFATIRERYPDLMIENCSGGGNRLDFGLLPYTDAGWMDDQSVPSARVRHNLEGLSAVLPPAYLYSFIMDTEQEPIDTFPGLSLLFRSRMPGMLGVSWRGEEIGEGERKRIQREISIYKQIREIMHDANAHLLTDQVGIDGGYGWDVIQQVSASSGNALIFAFSGEEASRRINVQPRNLRRDAIYEVSSVDYGPIGQATGHELMTQGVEIDRDVDLPAHVIVLRVIGQPVPVIRR